MEAQATFVGPDGAVELHTISSIYVHNALVITPRHPERDGAFRFNYAFEQCGVCELRMGCSMELRARENPQ
jgi:hypothetical protein